MIRPDQIPPEVVEAALHAYDVSFKNEYKSGEEDIAEAIAAALNAWPWKFTADSIKLPHIILPLPTGDGQ